jgi:hypothetical protein
MASVAQLVRASVCGTEGRGFKTLHSPHNIFKVFFMYENITAHNSVPPTTSRALMPHEIGSLAYDAQRDIILSGINPNILGSLDSPDKDFDPRAPTQECVCDRACHCAVTEFADMQKHDALIVHTPFALLETKTPFYGNPLDPNDRKTQKTHAGMRLAWQLHAINGHEGFRFSTYKVGIWVAKALPIKGITHEIQTALQNAGCPKLSIDNRELVGFATALNGSGSGN